MVQTFCVFYTQNKDIENERDGAFDDFLSYKDHPPLVEVGNTVPGYDRSKSDPCNLMAVNMEVSDNQCYKRGTKQGILSHYMFDRNSEYVLPIIY